MTSNTNPLSMPPSGATSYRIMPSNGRVITLSRAQGNQNSPVKQAHEHGNQENVQPNIQSSTIYRFGETFHWGQTQQTPAPLARPLAPSQKSTHSPVPASKTHTAASVNGTSKVSASSFPGKSVPLKLSPAPKHTFKSGKWVHDEDEELRASIEEHGTDDWEKVASGVSTRSAQQCRDRWTLYLADGLNSNDLSNEEVELMKKLLPAYVRNRKKPWAKLAESFPNRTGTILKNAWKRYENSQKPKRALSNSSVARHRREEAERMASVASAEENSAFDMSSTLDESFVSGSQERLVFRFKVEVVDEALRSIERPRTEPLALRSLGTPIKGELVPDFATLTNELSPIKNFPASSSLFSPPRPVRASAFFSPARMSSRPPATPTPLRAHNPMGVGLRSFGSPIPMWRGGLDSSLYDTYDHNNAARLGGIGGGVPGGVSMGVGADSNAISAASLFNPYGGNDLHSSIMLPDMHTANASISEFADPSSNGWLFPDAQPGHNPWSVGV